MRTLLYQWIKVNSPILVNAGSLVGTTAVTSVLGFAYWWLAARQFSPEAVGFASAAISAMVLIASASVLGLGTLLIGELPRQSGKEVSLISAALIVVGGVGGCLGIVFAVVAPLLSTDFQPLRANVQDIALFAAGVSLTAITSVLDQALIGLLRGGLELGRNTLFAVAKLAALFGASLWLSHTVGLTIYATWAVGNGLSLVALAGFVVLKGKWTSRTYLPYWGLLGKLRLAALQHHMLNLILNTPPLALPVLVTVMLSTRMNAWFYVSWMVADVVSVVSAALTAVLYAASSAQPAALAHKARMTLSLAFVSCVLANSLLQLGARQLLAVFGHTYTEQALWSLRILGFGAFPLIIKHHYIAISRVQGLVARALLPVGTGVFLELGSAALGARLGGLSGLSLGWLIAVGVESVFMFRTVYKAVQLIDTSTQTDTATQATIRQGDIETELGNNSLRRGKTNDKSNRGDHISGIATD